MTFDPAGFARGENCPPDVELTHDRDGRPMLQFDRGSAYCGTGESVLIRAALAAGWLVYNDPTPPEPEPDLHALLVQARQALIHTREYVEPEVNLPPIEGWSWFDAVEAITAALGDDFTTPGISLPSPPEEPKPEAKPQVGWIGTGKYGQISEIQAVYVHGDRVAHISGDELGIEKIDHWVWVPPVPVQETDEPEPKLHPATVALRSEIENTVIEHLRDAEGREFVTEFVCQDDAELLCETFAERGYDLGRRSVVESNTDPTPIGWCVRVKDVGKGMWVRWDDATWNAKRNGGTVHAVMPAGWVPRS